MARIINRTSSGGPAALLGGIGQGLSNFVGAKMGKEQLNMQRDQQNKMNDLMQKIYGAGMPAQQINRPSIQPMQPTGVIQAAQMDVPPMQQNLSNMRNQSPTGGAMGIIPQNGYNMLNSQISPYVAPQFDFNPVNKMIGGGTPPWMRQLFGG